MPTVAAAVGGAVVGEGVVSPDGPVASAKTRNVAINERFDEYMNGGGQRILERSRTGSSDDNATASANGARDGGETGSVNGANGEQGRFSKGWSKARKKSKDLSVFWK